MNILVGILSALCVVQLFADTQTLNDTVFLAILARNKAHMLPAYLLCMDKLDYDKQLITVYINTNNNSDMTEEILQEWVERNKHEYKQILFESHEVAALPSDTLPHDWTDERLEVLGIIRNKSLQIAKAIGSDYYFVVDCDNFITPSTLKHLILKRKPIIAPMLTAIPDVSNPYTNFFSGISKSGYYKDHELYWDILRHVVIGTIQVPLVHCTYLIDAKYIDKLTYVDDSDHHEFVIFSRSARDNGVGQYICNEIDFGTLFHSQVSLNLEEEKQVFDTYVASLSRF